MRCPKETDPQRFSIHRLAHYCLDLSELFETERVVPVLIFLRRGAYAERLRLVERCRDSETIRCRLSEQPPRFTQPSLAHTPTRVIQ